MKLRRLLYSGLALSILGTACIASFDNNDAIVQAKLKWNQKTMVYGTSGLIYRDKKLQHPVNNLKKYRNVAFFAKQTVKVRLKNGKVINAVLIVGHGIHGYVRKNKLFMYKSAKNGINSNAIANGIPNSAAIKIALHQINTERQKRGIAPYVLNSKLMAVAKQRARQIASNFSHANSKGKEIYEGLISKSGMNLNSEAENIGMIDDQSKTISDDFLSDIHTMIYDDANANWGHRYNFLNKHNSMIGIGVYQAPNGSVYMAYDMGGSGN